MSSTLKDLTKELAKAFDVKQLDAVDFIRCKKGLVLFFESVPLFDRSENKQLIWENFSDLLIKLIEELINRWKEQQNSFLSGVSNREFMQLVPLLKLYKNIDCIIHFIQNEVRIRRLTSCQFGHVQNFAQSINTHLMRFDGMIQIIHQSFDENLNILTERILLNEFNHQFYDDFLLELEFFKLEIEDFGEIFPHPNFILNN